MSKQDTALEVIAEISGQQAAAIEPKMDLIADLNIDSPKALHLLVELEDKLGIEISDEDAARMDTVSDVLDYVGALA